MFKRIDHIEIVSADPERSLEFYTRILGFEIRQRKAVQNPALREVIYLILGDTAVELVVPATAPGPADASGQAGVRGIALEVADMQAAVAWLEERGIVIVRPPYVAGPSLRAEIRDPDGLMIELREWK